MVMMIKQRGEGTLKVMLMQYCDDSDVYTYLHTYVRHTIDKNNGCLKAHMKNLRLQ